MRLPCRMKQLVLPALFAASLSLTASLTAQVGGDGTGAQRATEQAAQNRIFDLDGDGKVSDIEYETVLRWELLNPDYKLTKKERKALEKRRAAEKKAEVARWDLNGDGKLDAEENRRRLEFYEKQARAQKKTREQSELDKPMMSYMGK